jgi:hypothetical protein
MEQQCNAETKKLCEKLWCLICFDRCFMSHEKSTFVLSDVNLLLVFKCSIKKLEFICNDCLHSFIKSPHDIVNDKSWCP